MKPSSAFQTPRQASLLPCCMTILNRASANSCPGLCSGKSRVPGCGEGTAASSETVHLSLALAGGLLLTRLLGEGDAEGPHSLSIPVLPELHLVLWEALPEVVRIQERVLYEAHLSLSACPTSCSADHTSHTCSRPASCDLIGDAGFPR